jgi:tetratricopeptide (TPR) repeat protein
MYNANRLFSDAEKARARGDTPAAETAYRGAIDKANRSLTKHPKSRWSDDALLLIARSHLALRDYANARQALEGVLQSSTDAQVHSTAEIQLGLIEAEMGLAAAALERLDRALSRPEAPAEIVASETIACRRVIPCCITNLSFFAKDPLVLSVLF